LNLPFGPHFHAAFDAKCQIRKTRYSAARPMGCAAL